MDNSKEVLEVLKDIRTGQDALVKEVMLLRLMLAGELERQENVRQRQRKTSEAVEKVFDDFYSGRLRNTESISELLDANCRKASPL